MIAEIVVQDLKTNNKAKCRIIKIEDQDINKNQELIISPEIIDDMLRVIHKTIKVSIQQMEVISILGVKNTEHKILDIYELIKDIIGDKIIGKGKLAIEIQKAFNCCDKTARTKIKQLTKEGYLVEDGHYKLKLDKDMYRDDFAELI